VRDDDDAIRADAIQQLMCHGILNIPAFEQRHRLDFAVYFADELDRLRAIERDGLIEVAAGRLRVTARGRFLLRIIAMCFDAHLARSQAAGARYSKAL
jgi:oxygen-independent coproporphyrinogen-3 oxidase